jgi:hypothetical protein
MARLKPEGHDQITIEFPEATRGRVAPAAGSRSAYCGRDPARKARRRKAVNRRVEDVGTEPMSIGEIDAEVEAVRAVRRRHAGRYNPLK